MKNIQFPDTFEKTFEALAGRFNKDILGLDTFMSDWMEIPTNVSNYPYCNFIDEGNETFTLEVAIAGFAKEDIAITVENSVLTIKGKKEDVDKTYLYNGIANRAFTKTFALVPLIEITEATIENGLLSLRLERVIPDAMKAKTIDIK